MPHRIWRRLTWILLLAAAPSALAQGTNPFAGDATAVEEGRRLFAVSCASCHGSTGEGGQGQAEGVRPPDLTRGVFKAGNRDADLYRVISNGSPGTIMPSFANLGSDQVWRLITFIRSLSAPSAVGPGDPAAGEALFWGKGDCGRCHQIGERGNRMGPDLTRGSRRATAQTIRQSIVAPGDAITPGYEVGVIVTNDGRTIRGLVRFFTNFAARIVDSNGNETTYLRDEVQSMSREMTSLMPANYGQLFTAAEVDDLAAYIIKLRNSNSGANQ